MTSATDLFRPKVSTMAESSAADQADGIGADGIGAGAMRPEDRIRSFIEDHQRRVVATVSLWTGSLDDAVDAVTDALGRAWERLDRGEPIDNLAAWVTHAAMNQIRSTHRRAATARRNRHLIAVVDTHDEAITGLADALDLRRALRELTRRQRDVVALYYALDLSTTEIATSLGVAPGTIKATLHQARVRLAELLGASRRPTTTDSSGASDV